MKRIVVADVDHGSCLSIFFDCYTKIQTDCGSFNNPRKAYLKWKNINSLNMYIKEEVFILSHFHLDHYNGLLYAASKGDKSFPITKVYYPIIPEFPESEMNKVFFHYLIALNIYIFGNITGLPAYDLLLTVNKITNKQYFIHDPVFTNKSIKINFNELKIIWPPRFIDTLKIRKEVKEAIIAFDKLIKKYKDLKEIDNRLLENKIFERYFPKESNITDENGIRENMERSEVINNRDKSDPKGKLPDDIRETNRKFRKVANYFSLAYYIEDKLLFLGDQENDIIKDVIRQLPNENCFFEVLITAHHGTHWHDELKKLKCKFSISSLGRQWYHRLRHEYDLISTISLNTVDCGDINICYKCCSHCGFLQLPCRLHLGRLLCKCF